MENSPFSPKSLFLNFTAFASKAFSDSEPSISPTSILKSPFLTEHDSIVGLKIVENDSPKSPILKIQIPNSILEFGTKTRNSKSGLIPSPRNPDTDFVPSPEMELSEDYTCVISRGGHVTKMTRIFDDCVVDSCYGGSSKVDFLSFCHTCRQSLGEGKDIFIYRGEKAFCSDECRGEAMEREEED